MAKLGTPNYEEIVSFLRKHGIDANKVQARGMDETGYEEIQTYDNGRPAYQGQNTLRTIRREWPSLAVYRMVVWLWSGGKMSDLPEEEAPKKDPEPAEPPTPDEKQKEPAKAEPAKPAARKKAAK